MRRLIRNLARASRSERGVTLVELMVATTVGLAALAGAGMVIVMAARNTPKVTERSADIEAGQVLLERTGREVRQGYRIMNATATRMDLYTFQRTATCGTDTPIASSAPATACRITYSCSTAGVCTRTETSPDGTATPKVEQVATGLMSNSVFAYSPSATAPEYITMTLSFTGEGGDDNVTLQDGFELRNR